MPDFRPRQAEQSIMQRIRKLSQQKYLAKIKLLLWNTHRNAKNRLKKHFNHLRCGSSLNYPSLKIGFLTILENQQFSADPINLRSSQIKAILYFQIVTDFPHSVFTITRWQPRIRSGLRNTPTAGFMMRPTVAI